MTPKEFLQKFPSDITWQELVRLREGDELDDLPDDQEFSLDIAKQMFPGREYTYMERTNLVKVFAAILSRNSATFSAMLFIAEYAAEHPSNFGVWGIDATASLSNFLRCGYDEDCDEGREVFASYRAYADVFSRIIESLSHSEPLTEHGRNCKSSIVHNVKNCLAALEWREEI